MEIQMKGIYKSFASVPVLTGVDFSLESGEVHALMGENGAGKSTLMKILTGVYTRDAGEIFIDGQAVCFRHPKEAEAEGVVFIHQELNTMKDLTVEENIFMDREIHGAFGILNKKAMREESEALMKRLNVDIDVSMEMRRLSVGQQQMVEIAKALYGNVKTLIMDEPTAALTPSETATLFGVIRNLQSQGVSIVYISHRMEEIFEICDRITVMRDGETAGVRRITETDMTDIVRLMIGRDIGERYPGRSSHIGDVRLRVEHLTKHGLFEDVSFDVRAGEILGISGLMGAGRTEVVKTIFGAYKADAGTVWIDGQEATIRSARDAIALGVGLVTEDRKTEGLLLDKSIEENISLANLKAISNQGVINRKTEGTLSEKDIQEFAIRCRDKNQVCQTLSGGNQQKVVFAKWISTHPRILILDEPTRGVDVGAKKEIYTIINDLAEQGVAIIMVSSDLPEVLGMSDRILVIHEGHVSGIVDAEEANQERVMILATGGSLS